MIMKKQLLMISLFFALGMFCACSDDDGTSKEYSESDIDLLLETKIGSANQNVQNVDGLPGWLQKRLSYVTKNIDLYKEFPELTFSVYQCEWKGKVFYFIPNPLESCFYCNTVFRSDGTMIEWNSIDQTIDFATNSSSWECIYKIVMTPDNGNTEQIKPIEEGADYITIADFFKSIYNHYSDTEYRIFFDGSDESQCLMINSTSELLSKYTGTDPFPDIDFNKYTLIVGQEMMPKSYYSVLHQELFSDGDMLRLNVYVPQMEGGYYMVQHLFYWGLYPKLHSSKITVTIIEEQL